MPKRQTAQSRVPTGGQVFKHRHTDMGIGTRTGDCSESVLCVPVGTGTLGSCRCSGPVRMTGANEWPGPVGSLIQVSTSLGHLCLKSANLVKCLGKTAVKDKKL